MFWKNYVLVKSVEIPIIKGDAPDNVDHALYYKKRERNLKELQTFKLNLHRL